jgi:hypothetical protein
MKSKATTEFISFGRFSQPSASIIVRDILLRTYMVGKPIICVGSLLHICPNIDGFMTHGSSRVDQQNPKVLVYKSSVEDRRRSNPRCHENHRDCMVLCQM